MKVTSKQTLSDEVLRRLRAGAYGGHYGGCPICGHSEGPFNMLRENWLVCSTHRLRWCVGVGLFDYLDGEWEAWEFIDWWLSRFREIPASETLSNPEAT